jgi:hypothetical protein
MPPAELEQKDLAGTVLVNLNELANFNMSCSEIAGYNPERFEAVALRVYLDEESIVTIYAKDRDAKDDDILHVHKFKKEMNLNQLLKYIKNLNFTLSPGEYDLEKMEVINK